eukprot:CAMPEP_0172471174 /NCGR_PEP_ID=MMETSP1065-20121228/67682_1 /TAXON_ID=265537 /ORGANISM="Amphiprora paludosa, Strain CCMP125" /LENGTH=386 /DNA_ID=CAMNT_0013229265 /DNA_START=523 /DNA_END=1683 /DNA_ORIENTATION=-
MSLPTPSSLSATVNLLDLSAAAVACTVSASRTIMKIADPDDHEDGEKNIRTKVDGSFVTDADVAAQFIIVKALRTVSQEVHIIGEESQEEMEQIKKDYDYLDQDILRRTRQEFHVRRQQSTTNGDDETSSVQLPLGTMEPPSSESQIPSDPMFDNDDSVVVDASRVCVIVDPLDGTKSYAEGEYDVVSILIAIIVDNNPVFGVIGKPFGYTGHSPISGTDCVTFYGGPLIGGVYLAGGQGVEALPLISNEEGVITEDLPRAVISSSRSKGVVQDFCIHMGEKGLVYPEPLLISGAGEKSMRLILHEKNEAIWFYPKPGTSIWDVAAPDALLRSLGGRLTDKYGKEMDYSRTRDDFENVDGVVACIDEKLHARCIELFQEGDWLEQL